MPRPPRADVAGEIYHALNRGNGRMTIFRKDADYEAVERNALAAGLVDAAEEWRFGSLYNWCGGKCGVKLARWPLPRLPNWVERVNRPIDEKEEDQLRRAILRSQPYGDMGWVESTARKYGLESTLSKKGRPRKFPQTAK